MLQWLRGNLNFSPWSDLLIVASLFLYFFHPFLLPFPKWLQQDWGLDWEFCHCPVIWALERVERKVITRIRAAWLRILDVKVRRYNVLLMQNAACKHLEQTLPTGLLLFYMRLHLDNLHLLLYFFSYLQRVSELWQGLSQNWQPEFFSLKEIHVMTKPEANSHWWQVLFILTIIKVWSDNRTSVFNCP